MKLTNNTSYKQIYEKYVPTMVDELDYNSLLLDAEAELYNELAYKIEMENKAAEDGL